MTHFYLKPCATHRPRGGQPRGFAFLYVIIIITSILTVLALGAGTIGAFATTRTDTAANAAKLRTMADQCGEILLMNVRNSTSLVSSGTLSVQGSTCTYSISGTAPTKTITLSDQYATLYKNITITTSQVTPTIVANWTETP